MAANFTVLGQQNNTKTLANNITTNATSIQQCMSVLDDIQDAPANIRHILVTTFTSLGLASFVINSLVIWAILKTKTWTSQSTRLILLVSIIDVVNALNSNTQMSVYVLFAETLSCTSKHSMMVIVMFGVFALFFTIGLISFDRLMHTVFLNEYSTKFNTGRFNFAILVTFTIAAVQATLWGHGVRTQTNGTSNEGGGSKKTLPLNVMSCLAILIFQLVSMKRLSNIGAQSLSNEVKNLVKISAIYVGIYFAIYVPVIVFQFFQPRIQQHADPWIVSTIAFFYYTTPSLNGILNAIAFILSNRPCRRVISNSIATIIQKIRPPAQINPDQH